MTFRVNFSVVLSGAALVATGCAGLSAMQSSVTQLDQATHTANEAEVAFLRAYETSECRNANLDRVYASIERHDPDLRLSVQCTHVAVSDTDVKIRSTLLTAIALYADKLQALVSGDDASKLNSSSESVAKSINGFGKSSGLTQLQMAAGTDEKVAKGVEAAMIELTGFVLEHKKYKTIQDAAKSQQANLDTVVKRLKDENVLIGQALQNNLTGISGTIKLALAKERQDKSTSLFFDIVEAQHLQAANDALLSGALSATVPGGAAASGAGKPLSEDPQAVCGPRTATAQRTANTPVAPPAAQAVNDILDSIVAGNLALTESRPMGIMEASRWIESCGKSAAAVYKSLN